MAKFFKAKKSPAKSPASIEINVEQFNHDGQGIGYINNKICFVEGALPGERVKAQLIQDKAKMAKARSTKILDASPERINPPCPHFSLCGGCQLQYANPDYQLQLKQQAIASLFKRFANIDSLPWQDSLTGTGWQYRRAARIGV
ncbi:MAG: TRAM domain-containing protein, partial [Psychrosphaera sp.]|nr:TRAM domain-containing protein [Psychrosphaera sp.]